MRFSLYSCTLPLLVILLTTQVSVTDAQDKPSCLGYSKGAYTGNVTSDAECRTACETAEGMPEPDFKTSTCPDNNANGTNYICDCKKCDSSNSNCERRGLCVDKICSGSSSRITIMSAVTTMVVGLVVMVTAEA